MRPRPKGTIKLPKQLLDEIGENDMCNRYPSARRPRTCERKERRKIRRDQKGEQRQHQSAASRVDKNYEFEGVKGPKGGLEILRPSDVQRKQLKSILKPANRTRNHTPNNRENSTSSPARIPRRLRDKLAEDDAEIAVLERKLGIKGEKLPKAFVQDGLDILLCGLGEGDEAATIGGKRKRNDADDWLENKRKNTMAIEGPSREGEGEEDDGGVTGASRDEEENGVSLHPDRDLSDGDDPFGDSESYSSDSSRKPPRKSRENPYVAPNTSRKTQSTVKYVPPSLRKPSGSEPETLLRLRRQVQGLLNRLSEANLLSILGEVECLYRDNPRQHVTSTLVELIFSIVCDGMSLTDTFLVLHAGFIAAVYRIVGVDFGGSVVQRIVGGFDHYYNQGNESLVTVEVSSSGKAVINLIALLAELYNFQVVGSNLIFDCIRMFLAGVSEINTELLLKVIRVSGQQLRHDDPSALKDIVLMLQPAIASVGEANLSVRTKFMIETINDLKNNRLKAGTTASAVKSQHTIQMRKILGSLNTRAIRASEPMRLDLRDIRDADEKGKWWLVGASWSKGNGDLRNPIPSKRLCPQDRTASAEADGEGTTDLVQLAREQRMNTDIRRAIFITIMCASDFLDAHERLVKLRLKRAQELEIPRVLIHCAGAEQVYNPYYTLIAKRLCGERRLKMAFQFGLWGLFRRMGEGGDGHHGDAGVEEDEETEYQALGTRKLVNLAKLFGNLVAEGLLGLGVLKMLNLAYLQEKTCTFVELMLITIFLQSQRNLKSGRDERAIVDIFMQVKDVPQIIKGLTYFLKKVVSKTDVAGGRLEKHTVRWGCKVAGDTLRAIEMSVTERSALRPLSSSSSAAFAPSSFCLVARQRRGYASKDEEKDLVIIGGGVAGYVAAIKAGQEGLKTVCIEKRGTLGGTCLNVGCIPSKSLLNNSHLYHQILHDTKNRGIDVGDVKLNLAQMMKAKDTSVAGLTKGVEFLFRKNNVEYIKGTAAFSGEHEVRVDLTDGGEQILRAKNIIIATGSEATPFPGLTIDEKRIITSTGAIALQQVPKKMVVIGGGIIGLEMGSVWSRLGSEVTVVEFLGQIGGPGMDMEIAKLSQKVLQKQGIKFKLNTKVLGGEVGSQSINLKVEAAKGGKEETLDADVVLVAIGRRPYTAGLGLGNIGLETDEKGRVVIDQEYRTKLPHIRVIGDCTFGPMLAHKAEEEGVAAVELITKGHGHVNYNAIPSVMYTHPEVAWVGQNEQELKASGVEYKVGTFPFTANSRAKTNLDTEGMVKFIADRETDRILGIHIIGPNAGEMIAEGTLAIEYGASSEDIGRTSHAHPTLAEAFKEAAMATYGKAIHY
ncbi:hypothetical protein FGG08_003461 [Glutinoglossum americanum]|uniref:Dihydrolipoyl dehydrogenase n=1 Tax=Glutinoglossum americanum TaxID=1670608 RepID=A0A9P8L3G5_9PEZI|nr:hypothetical protein FGG08_003461 [Glutinoglossum americanum]